MKSRGPFRLKCVFCVSKGHLQASQLIVTIRSTAQYSFQIVVVVVDEMHAALLTLERLGTIREIGRYFGST